jgi:hypothetical protein
LISSIYCIFSPEVAQKIHSWGLKQKSYRILYLVNNLDENSLVAATTLEPYSTLCTLGLKEAIDLAMTSAGVSYQFEFFETDKQQELNETFLDSFDLVVVGGVSYWWIYATDSQREALLQTQTPIITSANLGFNSNPSLNNMVGVHSNKDNDSDVWASSVLSVNFTTVEYDDVRQEQLRSISSYSDIYLVDVIPEAGAQAIAYAFRGETQYAYIVFNGTKNFYINTFTYPDIGQTHEDAMIVLDQIFNLFADEYLEQIWGKISIERTIENTLIVPAFFMVTSSLYFKAIECKRHEKSRIKINLFSLKKAALLSTLLLITFLLIVSLITTTVPYLPINQYISVEYLVFSVGFMLVAASIMLGKDSAQGT